VTLFFGSFIPVKYLWVMRISENIPMLRNAQCGEGSLMKELGGNSFMGKSLSNSDLRVVSKTCSDLR